MQVAAQIYAAAWHWRHMELMGKHELAARGCHGQKAGQKRPNDTKGHCCRRSSKRLLEVRGKRAERGEQDQHEICRRGILEPVNEMLQTKDQTGQDRHDREPTAENYQRRKRPRPKARTDWPVHLARPHGLASPFIRAFEARPRQRYPRAPSNAAQNFGNHRDSMSPTQIRNGVQNMTNPIRIYQAMVVIAGLQSLKRGIMLNTSYTLKNLLATAEFLTGIKYKRTQSDKAISDLENWIVAAKTGQDSV
jgi:hypothetical protein